MLKRGKMPVVRKGSPIALSSRLRPQRRGSGGRVPPDPERQAVRNLVSVRRKARRRANGPWPVIDGSTRYYYKKYFMSPRVVQTGVVGRQMRLSNLFGWGTRIRT